MQKTISKLVIYNQKYQFLRISINVDTEQEALTLNTIASTFFLLAIFIFHSRESKLYRYVLDGMSALAWELLFPKCLDHLSSS